MGIPPIGSVASQALPGSLPELGSTSREAASPIRIDGLSGVDRAAFDQAVGAPVHELQAAPVQDAATLGSHIASGVQNLAQRLVGWQKAHAAPAASAASPSTQADKGTPSLTKAMEDAVAGMQGAYAFAIEATLASHGSTELTKVFNTLLKGQ